MTQQPHAKCIVCRNEATKSRDTFSHPFTLDCPRCGRFSASEAFYEDWRNHRESKTLSLRLSHWIRRQASAQNPTELKRVQDVLNALENFNLPTPAESLDLLIEHVGDKTKETPGEAHIEAIIALSGICGLTSSDSVDWIADEARKLELATLKSVSIDSQNAVSREQQTGAIRMIPTGTHALSACLTLSGWRTYDELKRTRNEGKFAFFARKFDNKRLDDITKNALEPAVKRTGYDLRMVPQKAGLIDAIMEHEIRTCKFLISDLSDENAGAYWEAGFAEGLGKKVIYVCDEAKKGNLHFDTSHRTTLFWSLNDPKRTEDQLTAIIRNSLGPDAKQND